MLVIMYLMGYKIRQHSMVLLTVNNCLYEITFSFFDDFII